MLIKMRHNKQRVLEGLGVKPGALLIGDMRQALGEDLARAVKQVVEHAFKKGYRQYYILVHSNNAGGNIKTTIMIYDRLPPRLLGTICYYINNETGDTQRLWVLPMDYPVPDDLLSDDRSGDVIESGKNLPILY